MTNWDMIDVEGGDEEIVTTGRGLNWGEMNKKLTALLAEWRANPEAVEARFEARLKARPELALGTPIAALFETGDMESSSNESDE